MRRIPRREEPVWILKKNFYELQAPDHNARHDFFAQLVDYIKVSPAEFPDPENRKRENLSIWKLRRHRRPSPRRLLPRNSKRRRRRKIIRH